MLNSKPNTSKYKDFDFDFSANEITDDVKMKSGIQSIAQSIKNILLTYPGERPFSDVGGGVMDFLFENDTPATLVALRERVVSLLINYEPRVRVGFDDVITQRLPDSSLVINIKYALAEDLGLNNTQNVNIVITGEANSG